VVPPLPDASAHDEPVRAVAPVGRERRAQLWAAVAARLGPVYDPEAERLSATVGAVSLSVRLEGRGARGFYTVATLAWPGLGLELEVNNRRWSDFLSSIETGDVVFDGQFSLRAREARQARALLDAAVREALLAFAEVRVTDEGAVLAAPGAGQALRPFEDFVRHALATAVAIDAAIPRVPLPEALTTHASAWRAFAERLGGRLEPGRPWIHGGTYGMERVDVGTAWSHRGALESTVISMALDLPADASAAPVDPAMLPSRARALRGDRARGAARRAGAGRAAGAPARARGDPSTLEPLIDRMARLRRALRGGGEAGPFR
jgi:hypothetical protein